jgi:EAL domain-containing protein (putative c-di-GMP-specific phosphodiesterase class I)
LVRLDCDGAQGHFISPPMPVAKLINWLKNSSWQPAQQLNGTI